MPNEARVENRTQRQYFAENGTVLLEDYVKQELASRDAQPDESRIVVENDHWLVVVPFWAVWPFETLLLPKVKKIIERRVVR